MAKIEEIIVISSGSTDNTNRIVQECTTRNNRIRLLTEPIRKGKTSAINLWLKEALGDICIMIGADTLPSSKDSIEELIKPFASPIIGMVGARPVPLNDAGTFMGFTVHLYWKLHHLVALEYPKCGEVVAFKNIVPRILSSASDEANIEAEVIRQGYTLAYAPKAIFLNRGATTIGEYLKQRRRQAAGNLQIRKQLHYKPATQDNILVFDILLRNAKFTPKMIAWTIGAMAVEGYGRLLGRYDWHVKKDRHVNWEMIETTKELQCLK